MWAFALWDARGERLFCSRDRFGVKPFYYRCDGGRLVFASEPKAFRADPETRLRAEPRASSATTSSRATSTTPTRRSSPASRGCRPRTRSSFDRAGCASRATGASSRTTRRPATRPGAFRELLLDAVRLRLRSDVPVGTCLSRRDRLVRDRVRRRPPAAHRGENARPVGERQQTFTAYFDEPRFDERPYARAVVERTGAEPHWISFDGDELVDDAAARSSQTQDEPFGSTSIVAPVVRDARGAREPG